MNVLGICDGQDCGASLVQNGRIIAAVNEERLSRIKLHEGYYNGFPERSIKFILKHIPPDKIDSIAISSKVDPPLPLRLYSLFTRPKGTSAPTTLIKPGKETLSWRLKGKAYDYFCQKESSSFTANISLLTYKPLLSWYLRKYGLGDKKIFFVDHHMCHAASACYTSGKEKGISFSLDGHGDGLSATIASFEYGQLRIFKKVPSSASLGWFYGAVTNYLGFKQHRHEGKVTGLAAFGDPSKIYSSFTKCIAYDPILHMPKNNLGSKFHGIHAIAHYIPKGSTREDIAAAAQKRLEDVVIRWIQDVLRKYKDQDIMLSGGTFANVKLNQKIHEIKGVKSIFIHPHMGDGGLAAGAALYVYHKERKKDGAEYAPQKLENVYFGPEYSTIKIKRELEKNNLNYEKIRHIEKEIAHLLTKDNVVARFNGRMEYGPRALGNRTLLYHTKDKTVNDWLNKHLKRTEFMPFAPVTMKDFAEKSYINLKGAEYAAKFMTICFETTATMKRQSPAVVHVDGTARPQLISKQDNLSYYTILDEYYSLTGIPSLINTSFNMHEEPIVCSPYDAIRAFKLGKLNYLAIGDFLVSYDGQKKNRI